VSGLPGFRASSSRCLARGKLLHVGECVAMCAAATRAEAEDLAEQVALDIEELPAVHDMLEADAAGAPRLHEAWPDNTVLTTLVEDDLSDLRDAPIVVRRRLRTARQCMSPLEGRGVLARWDGRLEQLEVHSSAQMPHINRTGIAEALGLDEGRVRVISPDVGGGFGYKGILLPEEIALGWLARRLGRPVRWIEDRREQLTANANCRGAPLRRHAYAAADGTLLGLDCEAVVDSGAYSSYPFSACLEAAQVASILPGPYRFRRYRCRTRSGRHQQAADPALPRVARTGVCYAMEVVLDAVARRAGVSAEEVRLAQPRPAGGDALHERHEQALRQRRLPGSGAPRRRRGGRRGLPGAPAAARAGGQAHRPRLRGVLRAGRARHQRLPRLGHPDGAGHGAVRRAPLARRRAGAPPRRPQPRPGHGNHHGAGGARGARRPPRPRAAGPRRHRHDALLHRHLGQPLRGDVGRRGGSACEVLRERVLAIGAHLLQAGRGAVRLEAGAVVAPGGASVPIAEVARTFYRAPQNLPPDVDPGGLEATAGHRPKRDTGTFSYACHAVEAEVDTGTGAVRLNRYVVVEDAGTMLNPMVVDGQVLGGLAQGIGTALLEEMPFDDAGQPLASTLADYLLPGPGEVPDVEIVHMETPSPLTRFGQKGIGESGAIGPPAAIANAVNDALADLGVELLRLPITPERVLDALAAAVEAPERRAA
jgi:carbon-monoxide dehydrogenase large subunit